jgi:hypothetical protein
MRLLIVAALAAVALTLFTAPPAHAEPAACAAPTITGTSGNNNIIGTPGDDVIAGLGGDDTIRGNGATT